MQIPDNAKEITADISSRRQINMTKNEGVEYCGVYNGSVQVPSSFGSAEKANNAERLEWRHNFTFDTGEEVQFYGFAHFDQTMRTATVGARYGFYFIGKIDGKNRCRVFELEPLARPAGTRDEFGQLPPTPETPF